MKMYLFTTFVFSLINFVTVIASSCEAEDNCKLESLGCYGDSFQRSMPEQILNERDRYSNVFSGYTIDWNNYEKYILAFACRCAKVALQKGYSVIGLQFYGECWSGPNAHNTYHQYGMSTQCVDGKFRSYSKQKDCTRYVGRQWVNHVYRIGVPGCDNLKSKIHIEPVGCFHDDQSSPRPVPNYILNERDIYHKHWNGKLIDWANWQTYSPEMICRCAEAAAKRGDDYFAIQFWGECWSGKGAVNYQQDGVSHKCKNEDFKECKCDSYNCVGTAYTNYVYKLKYCEKDHK